ncbi:MAG: aldo/keto reductase [Oscillospiraceae bacterium]|jgi:L-galactose dehydrogenase|nr:aldo/keto reductase [Oscillospiraceae bacterium]
MTTTTLGRTGLTVTAAGLGCGGFSRIGIAQGLAHAAGIVRAAYDLGVTFFDTATAYGTQEAVGEGLSGIPRGSYVISTKFPYRSFGSGGLMTPEEAEKTLDDSLRELKTDYVDVWHIHALVEADVAYARDALYPAMKRAQEKGKIRFLGVTEQFGSDTSHKMFRTALPDDLFDVIMTGYNLINPSAANFVLPEAIERNVAALCMFAVRKALHDRAQLASDLQKILAAGQGGAGLSANAEVLGFLTENGVADSLPEAAYRFCRHTPGITVTLTGTGNAEHLRANLAAIEKPKLPDDALATLRGLFGNVDCVSGQ